MSLTFRRYSAGEARGSRDLVEAVFRGAYWEALERGDLFDTPEAFMGRFDAYASNPLLDLVVAFDGGEPVGQTWGWPLGANSRWWESL